MKNNYNVFVKIQIEEKKTIFFYNFLIILKNCV